MKISTETYQYQSYSGQYERFAPAYVQPDYVLCIDAIISYYFIKLGTYVEKRYVEFTNCSS